MRKESRERHTEIDRFKGLEPMLPSPWFLVQSGHTPSGWVGTALGKNNNSRVRNSHSHAPTLMHTNPHLCPLGQGPGHLDQ